MCRGVSTLIASPLDGGRLEGGDSGAAYWICNLIQRVAWMVIEIVPKP